MLQHLSWSRGLKNNFALNLSGLNSLVKDELGMPEIYFVCFLAPLSPKLWNLRSQILKQCTHTGTHYNHTDCLPASWPSTGRTGATSAWSPSMPSTLRATIWGGDTVCEWKRFSALAQLTLILVSQDFPPVGAGPTILIERTHLWPKKI